MPKPSREATASGMVGFRHAFSGIYIMAVSTVGMPHACDGHRDAVCRARDALLKPASILIRTRSAGRGA